MKGYTTIICGILLAIVLLLVSGLPASAKTTSTPFTGSCSFLAEPPSPDVKMWQTGQNELHLRNEIQAMNCQFSDPRLDGVYLAVINWDVKEYSDPFYYILGHDYGQMSLAEENGDLLWEGIRNTFYTGPWAFSGQVVWHGRGAYAGLKVMADIWGDFTTGPNVQLSGNIYGTIH
jgi:hypothetical protein